MTTSVHDDVVLVGHTTDGPSPNWLRAELTRVFQKLRLLNQLPSLAVSFDPGVALLATEVALIRAIPVTWHTLVPDDQLAGLSQVDGYVGRTTALAGHPLVVTDVLPAPHGTSRARRAARSALLARRYRTHVVVYDGRDRGTVLDHLQRVMGTHDVIHVDPLARSTIRIPATHGVVLYDADEEDSHA